MLQFCGIEAEIRPFFGGAGENRWWNQRAEQFASNVFGKHRIGRRNHVQFERHVLGLSIDMFRFRK
jgi:hypothetical protein